MSALTASPALHRSCQELGAEQYLAAVGGIRQRAAEQGPSDQREHRRERDQPDIERRAGQYVHLVRHRDGGELGAKRGQQLPGDQAAQVAGSPQRGDVQDKVPPEPGNSLHNRQAKLMTDGQSMK